MATRYYTIQPNSTLSNVVKFFWVLESDNPSYCHRSMADVYSELVFHYKGQFDEIKPNGEKEKSPLAGIQGQTKQTSRYSIAGSFGIFGVYLYPFVLPLIFGIPATAFSDQYVTLQSILGREGQELEERIMLAANNRQRVDIISGFLQRRTNLYESNVLHPGVSATVKTILQSKGNTAINQLAQQACLSERQYERNFQHLTGFGPKLFSRIVRFHAAFNEYHALKDKTLTQIALANGYYDQSHFIEDFKVFSGLTPKIFYSGQAEGFEWMKS